MVTPYRTPEQIDAESGDALDALHAELKRWQAGANSAVESAAMPGAQPHTRSGNMEGWSPEEDALFSDDANFKSIRDARNAAREARKTKVEVGEPVITSRVPAAPSSAAQASGVRGAVSQAVMGANAAPARDARLPADTSVPLGISAPRAPAAAGSAPVDSELRAAQAADESSKRMGELGRAVTGYAERPDNTADYLIGLGRGGRSEAPAHNARWDQPGESAVAELGARRQADAGLAAQQASAKRAADAKDPNSDTARMYRGVLKRFAPELNLDGATPEQMERIAPWLEKVATNTTASLKSQAEIEQAKEKAALHQKEYGENQSWRQVVHEDSQANAAATRALAAAARSDRQAEARDAKDQAGAQHLGDKAGEAQSAAAALNAIDATIAAHPQDIPGVGKWKSKLPDFAANLLLSDEGLGVRNNARDVLGVLLHKRSGAAVSPAELARYEQMYGLNGDDSAFQAGVQRMRRDFASELASTQAGVSEGAKAKFKAGGGMLAEDIAPAAAGGVVQMKDAGGKTYAIPASQVKEAEADGLVRF
jgi:hypothetical protein